MAYGRSLLAGLILLILGAAISMKAGPHQEAASTMSRALLRQIGNRVFQTQEEEQIITDSVDSPTLYPSDAPSLVPSSAPSSMPSDAPSMVPSDSPSSVPTLAPTMLVIKSDFPSIVPIVWPEMTPPPSPEILHDDMVLGDDVFNEDVASSSSAPSDAPSLVPTVSPTVPIPAMRYDKQTCAGTKTETGSNMRPVVVQYVYSLTVEDGQDPRVAMGLVEDYFVDITKELYCTSSSTDIARTRNLQKDDTVFSASPADLPSRQGCSASAGPNCALVEGGTTIWIPVNSDGDEDPSAKTVTCEVSDQIQFLVDNGYLNTLPGVVSTQLEFVTSCPSTSRSIRKFSYVAICGAAVVFLALAVLVRRFTMRRMKDVAMMEEVDDDDDSKDSNIIVITDEDSAVDAISNPASSAKAAEAVKAWLSDNDTNDDLESPSYITNYEYYNEAEPRKAIMIDSKLLGLSMKSIPETRSIVETSSNEEPEKWETIELNSVGSI